MDVAKRFWKKALGFTLRATPNGAGLLFQFKKPGRYSIWMIGMRFDIDVLWIFESRVVGIEQFVNAPKKWILSIIFPYFLPRYSPEQNIDQILEVEAGYCKSNNINSKIYKLRLNVLRRFIIIGKK